MLVPLLCVLIGLICPVAALAYLYQDQLRAEKLQLDMLLSSQEHVNETELSVSGLSDEDDEQQLNSIIRQLPGIRNIRVSPKEGKAVISFDKSKISLIEITDRINSYGYGVAC